MNRPLFGLVLVALFIASFDVAAQESQPTTQPAIVETPETQPVEELEQSDDEVSAEVEVSEAERKMLEEALGADSKDTNVNDDVETKTTGLPVPNVSFLDMSFVLDVAGAYFTEEPDQLGAHDPNATGFHFQQLELSLGANVDPFFRLDANLVFALFGVEVEEAYATAVALPGSLQFRAGQFLTKFGRLNSTHPHHWSFLDQPLANGKFFGGEGSRGLGAEVSWLTPLPWYVEVIGSVHNADGECCARSFLAGSGEEIDGLEDFLYTTALKQTFGFGPSNSLSWGLSAQFGPNPSGFGNRTEIYGTDIYFRHRPVKSATRTAVSFTAEVLFRNRQVPRDVLQDVGLYSQVIWSINPRWEIGGRYELVTGVEDDPLDPEWSTNRQRVAIQGTFFPTHFSRIRLQPMVDDIPGRGLVGGAMLNLEVVAGAHGAHAF